MAETLPNEVLRGLLLEHLETIEETQFANVLAAIENLAKRKKYYLTNPNWGFAGQVTTHQMPKEDREKLRQLIWDLIFSGILVPGSNESNLTLPFLRVTPFGKKCIQARELLPYDPEGFLSKFKTAIPNVDNTIYFYLEESLRCLRYSCHTASTVMLGVSSEKAILLLGDALTASLKDPKERGAFQNTLDSARGVKKKHDVLFRKLNEKRKLIPKQIEDDMGINLSSVFNLIREYRNAAGHPTGKQIDRSEAFAHLQLFPSYIRKIYTLIDFLDNNQV